LAGPGVSFTFTTIPNNWIYEWALNAFNQTSNLTNVYSMSEGWSENNQCDDGIAGNICQQLGIDSATYVKRSNAELLKLASIGYSTFVSSGDSGAATRTNPFCSDTNVHPVHANFPASSPYVTSVGGTQLLDSGVTNLTTNVPSACAGNLCAANGIEWVWGGRSGGGASAGGFSDYAATPTWQKNAVSHFLSGAGLRPPSNYFNASGRGVPDIAAIGDNLYYFFQGSIQAGGGTSFSAPTVAGLFGRLNAERAANGKKPIGFANPTIYALYDKDPSSYNDILYGNNYATEYSFCTMGYGAAAGWDPTTGVGSINYPKLSAFVNSLP